MLWNDDEKQKVLKDNSPLIDGQTAKTFWKYMKTIEMIWRRKKVANMKSILLKTGTVGQVMLGRWKKSNISNYHKTYLDWKTKCWMKTKTQRTKHGCDELRRYLMEKLCFVVGWNQIHEAFQEVIVEWNEELCYWRSSEWIDEFRRQVPLRKLCLVDEWNQTHELFQIIAIEEAKHESINLRRQVPMENVMLRRRKKSI